MTDQEAKQRHPNLTLRTGEKYGRITLLEFAGMSPSKQGAMYHVRCDCGTEKQNYLIGNLRRKRSPIRSCGCINIENHSGPQPGRRDYAEYTKRNCYSLFKYAWKRLSKKNGKASDFWTLEQWYSLASSPCHYCGNVDVRNIAKARAKEGGYYSKYPAEEVARYDLSVNGVDRIDSSKGYLFDNCVSCCGQCNIAKSDYTKEEFIAMASRIVSKWGSHA